MRNRKAVWVSAAAVTGLALTGGGVTAGLVWADPADGGGSAQANCEVKPLTEDGFSHADDVSPSGERVAGATYTEEHAEAERTPVFWETGKPTDITDAVSKAFSDYSGAELLAINDDGVAAGGHGLDLEPFRYEDGKTVPLDVPDGVDDAVVKGISGDGTILAVGQKDSDDVAVTWEPGSDSGSVVDAPKGVQVVDIDDNGELAGYSEKSDDTYQVWHTLENKWIDPEGVTPDSSYMDLSGEFLLAGNLMVDLTTGEGAEHDVANPRAVDANGTVYGTDDDDNPVMDAGDGAVEMPSNDTDEYPAAPQAVNEDGSVIVGESSSGADEHTTTHAVSWACEA